MPAVSLASNGYPVVLITHFLPFLAPLLVERTDLAIATAHLHASIAVAAVVAALSIW